MKIAIVTFWYNEQDLAPFFLKHYRDIDKILLYLDADTDDSTREICEKYGNVELRSFTFPKGFDDIIKVEKVNEVVRSLRGQFDWVYAVDADELIFVPKEYKDAREFLGRQEEADYNLVYAKMFQVYRHITDKDLDASKPTLLQRQHGDPNFGIYMNRLYVKPIIVKPGIDIIWAPGCHFFKKHPNIKQAKDMFYGAHWQMVDEKIAIRRRIRGIKLRLSERQIAMHMTWQHINATQESIRKECEKHSNDPNILRDLLREEHRNA